MDGSSTATASVVVGVDPSDGARAATLWAADLAAAWGAPLRLVHAEADGGPTNDSPSWLSAVARAAGDGPAHVEVVAGAPADVLVRESAGARMVVLGSYGSGARSGMLAGSVALALVDGAACPVAVVRGPAPQVPPPRNGPVVVGADGSEAGCAALELAADLAVSLGSRLVAVCTWLDKDPKLTGSAHVPAGDPQFLAARDTAVLDAALEALAVSHPGIAVDRELVWGTPVRTLLERAAGARMLVVGHRGRDPGTGMLRGGSTSRALVEFALCPVVVTGVSTEPARVPRADKQGTASS